VDEDNGGLRAIEGEIVSDDEVAVAESSNVRISWDSAYEWLGGQRAEILFDAGQDALSGRGVVNSDVFVDVGKVLFCEGQKANGSSTRRHGVSCGCRVRHGPMVVQCRQLHAGPGRQRAC